jgi:glycosyltransferase involved in cell wall biosynthesis
VSDNASTDGTRDICQRFAAADPRVRYLRNETNVGAAPNYNRLVALARGRYFKWAAHDDRCRPAFLEECLARLQAAPDVVLAYPATEVIDGEGRRVSTYRDGLALHDDAPHARLTRYLRGNFTGVQGMCNPVFGVIRTDVLRRTRLIQDFLASDRSLLGHLALLGKFAELDDVLFERRVHRGTSTMANTTFEGRKAWFNTGAAGRAARRPRFDNHLALRITHIRDYYRAIAELVDDDREKAACRRALTVLLVSKPKWIYRDIKYSLGFHPKAGDIIRSLQQA